MTFSFTLISGLPNIFLSYGLVGWGGIFLFAIALGALVWKWREYDKTWGRDQWGLFLGLAATTLLTSLLFKIELTAGQPLPQPNLPLEPAKATIVLLSAVPFALAAGLLGPTAAVILALFSGLLQALWDTHSLFTSLELGLVAWILSAAICQRYRTNLYRALRHPIVAALLAASLYPLIYITATLFSIQGVLVSRLDYAWTHLLGSSISMGVELLIAGLFAEFVMLAIPARWGIRGQLIPSPSERSLQARLLYNMAPLALGLILALIIGNLAVSNEAARQMLRSQMSNAAATSAENIPYFLETGQNLITQFSKDARLLSTEPGTIVDALEQDIQAVPFFDQLVVLNTEGVPLAAYPPQDLPPEEMISLDEDLAIQLALSGIPYQTLTLSPLEGENTARIAFLAAVGVDGNAPGADSVNRVLIGRTSLASNPYTQPTLIGLNSIPNGEGILIDENKRILMHPDPNQLMTEYTGNMDSSPAFYQDTAPDGTRSLIYFQQVPGRSWSIALSVPSRIAQQMSLNIAGPLLGMIIITFVIAVLIVRAGLRLVTSSLQNLSKEARRIAQGQLDHPMQSDGEDEIGQLRRSFEQMRLSLKARLDELNRLLLVSRGVASSLEISEAVQPVLDSVLATGASSVRIVLTPAVVPDIDGDSVTPVSFGQGPSHLLYRDLDDQILAFTRQQERLALSNVTRPRLLNFTPGAPRPESLAAVALRHENLYYGTLWAAYDEPHNFSEEEIRFLVTLGGQAALAAANARLFLTAEIGRQRLAAILASSPDPILVTDQNDRMLLANPAAWQALGMETNAGQPIEKVISQDELVELLRSSSAEQQTKEVPLSDGRVYLASATSVLAEGQRMGRVCVLRDVTHFKELDALKSDFVSTVSHDLRSPLTLMRGYATMLEMVGELNEQQTGYVRKIVSGVESMSRMVNNLLDLGRIEAGVGLQVEMISVHDVIERVVGALQLQAAQKRIQLTYEIPTQTIPLIEADQALLQQALQNLVENAIKYTKPEGKVHVRVRVQPIGMVFEISDTGIGISPMDQQRLFEKFYRGANEAAREQRGTGLGLAIVKSIAERHGGRVWADSQLGKGSTFHLAIPLRQPRRENK